MNDLSPMVVYHEPREAPEEVHQSLEWPYYVKAIRGDGMPGSSFQLNNNKTTSARLSTSLESLDCGPYQFDQKMPQQAYQRYGGSEDDHQTAFATTNCLPMLSSPPRPPPSPPPGSLCTPMPWSQGELVDVTPQGALGGCDQDCLCVECQFQREEHEEASSGRVTTTTTINNNNNNQFHSNLDSSRLGSNGGSGSQAQDRLAHEFGLLSLEQHQQQRYPSSMSTPIDFPNGYGSSSPLLSPQGKQRALQTENAVAEAAAYHQDRLFSASVDSPTYPVNAPLEAFRGGRVDYHKTGASMSPSQYMMSQQEQSLRENHHQHRQLLPRLRDHRAANFQQHQQQWPPQQRAQNHRVGQVVMSLPSSPISTTTYNYHFQPQQQPPMPHPPNRAHQMMGMPEQPDTSFWDQSPPRVQNHHQPHHNHHHHSSNHHRPNNGVQIQMVDLVGGSGRALSSTSTSSSTATFSRGQHIDNRHSRMHFQTVGTTGAFYGGLTIENSHGSCVNSRMAGGEQNYGRFETGQEAQRLEENELMSYDREDQEDEYEDDDQEETPTSVVLVPSQARGRLPMSVAEQMSEQACKFVRQHGSSSDSHQQRHRNSTGSIGSRDTVRHHQHHNSRRHHSHNQRGYDQSNADHHRPNSTTATTTATSTNRSSSRSSGGGLKHNKSNNNLQVRRTLRVKIRKSKPILGIAIEGGFNVSGQLLPRIVCVHEEGAAYQCGKLRASDLILEVNGISTVNMTHNEIAQTIASAYYQDERPYIELLIGESVQV